MVSDEGRNNIEARFRRMKPYLDERSQRLFVANEALSLGYGGIELLSQITGVSRVTIRTGCAELSGDQPVAQGRIRRQGGGRRKLTDKDSTLLPDLEWLLNPATRGDPESPLLWTSKSTERLAAELKGMGHAVSHVTVATLLKELGYSLQANRKTQEGRDHPDRDQQFEHINRRTEQFQERNQPVISVDTKKKELVGNFKNGGREYHKVGQAPEVGSHDFMIKDAEHGKVNPYGLYDRTQNTGWVNLGTDHDTPAFAVASIARWWDVMGQQCYPEATELLITADAGGSNGFRSRLWKRELQGFADRTGLRISVCHLPPGTSKWNKIEHRLFSHISMNWRGKPLVSHEVIVNLIAATRTKQGLTVNCELDRNQYPTGIKVTDKEMALINISRDDFHGEWNYTIHPSSATVR